MAELRKVNLPLRKVFEYGMEKKSLDPAIIQDHFSITDLPRGIKGDCADLPAATVVFDLSGSSLSIRSRGAKSFAAEVQDLFRALTEIIYKHNGIIEKFPGDGISMHFPAMEIGYRQAIKNAYSAVDEMDRYLRVYKSLSRQHFRFSMSYGADTIVTLFGSEKHQELISIGHSVNVAHKLEKYVKNEKCFLGMDENCKKVIAELWNVNLKYFVLDSDLRRDPSQLEWWYGVSYL